MKGVRTPFRGAQVGSDLHSVGDRPFVKNALLTPSRGNLGVMASHHPFPECS